VLDEELKLYLLSMLQMQEETQHAGQMVMQDEVANVSDKDLHFPALGRRFQTPWEHGLGERFGSCLPPLL